MHSFFCIFIILSCISKCLHIVFLFYCLLIYVVIWICNIAIDVFNTRGSSICKYTKYYNVHLVILYFHNIILHEQIPAYTFLVFLFAYLHCIWICIIAIDVFTTRASICKYSKSYHACLIIFLCYSLLTPSFIMLMCALIWIYTTWLIYKQGSMFVYTMLDCHLYIFRVF